MENEVNHNQFITESLVLKSEKNLITFLYDYDFDFFPCSFS